MSRTWRTYCPMLPYFPPAFMRTMPPHRTRDPGEVFQSDQATVYGIADQVREVNARAGVHKSLPHTLAVGYVFPVGPLQVNHRAIKALVTHDDIRPAAKQTIRNVVLGTKAEHLPKLSFITRQKVPAGRSAEAVPGVLGQRHITPQMPSKPLNQFIGDLPDISSAHRDDHVARLRLARQQVHDGLELWNIHRIAAAVADLGDQVCRETSSRSRVLSRTK